MLICNRCFRSQTTQLWVISRFCFAESIYGNVQSSKTHVLSNKIFCLATSSFQAVVVCHKSLINTRKRVHSDPVKTSGGSQFTLVMGKLTRCVYAYEHWWIKWKNKNKNKTKQETNKHTNEWNYFSNLFLRANRIHWTEMHM